MTLQLINQSRTECAKTSAASNESRVPISFAETFDNRTDGIWLKEGIDSIWKGTYGDEHLYSGNSKYPLTYGQVRDIARRIVNYKSAIFIKMEDGQRRILQAEGRIAEHFR